MGSHQPITLPEMGSQRPIARRSHGFAQRKSAPVSAVTLASRFDHAMIDGTKRKSPALWTAAGFEEQYSSLIVFRQAVCFSTGGFFVI